MPTKKLVPDPAELDMEILKQKAIEKDFKDKMDKYQEAPKKRP